MLYLPKGKRQLNQRNNWGSELRVELLLDYVFGTHIAILNFQEYEVYPMSS